MTATGAPVGGFFELHEPTEAVAGPSLLEAWTGGRPFAAFRNARSAFAALTALRPTGRIWLPAFLCRSLAAPGFAGRVRFYPVQEGFEPDLAGLDASIAPGDLVMVVAHFGLPVAESVEAFVSRRPDVIFVEDRAQALDPGRALAGAYTLCSPRKLLGVADGGLLVSPAAGDAPLPAAAQPSDDEAALWRPLILRREDPLGLNNAAWHQANQAKEAAMAVDDRAMSVRSLEILAGASLGLLAERRLSNWRRLDADLRRWSALPAGPAAPPLGYVLRLAPDAREAVRRKLHARRIFAAVHWPEIAAPEEDFPREAQWTRELLTLPCDHRYGEPEMARVAATVAEVLG